MVRCDAARVVGLPGVTLSSSGRGLEGRASLVDLDHLAAVETRGLSTWFARCDGRSEVVADVFGGGGRASAPVESDMQTARCTPSGGNASRYRVTKRVNVLLRATKIGS